MSLYKDAGVDIDAGNEAVDRMKPHVKKTWRKEVLTDLGSFGALFQLDLQKFHEPVLVSGTDGVGTKLKVAFALDKHDTIGIDAVAMCVNDIVVQGAEPLFFLDYLACGKLEPGKVEQIVKGIADGCAQSGCALIGGETAEMPGMYADGEYDIAGFSVGAVNKSEIIDGSKVAEGSVIIGLASSGVHSNGLSLVRKIIADNNIAFTDSFAEQVSTNLSADLANKTVGEVILEPTKLYVKSVLAVKDNFELQAAAHITGGGFYENIPRVFPEKYKAVIEKDTWTVPAVFSFLQEKGGVPEREMYRTFNMGVGMMLIVPAEQQEQVLKFLADLGEQAYKIGHIEQRNAEEAGVIISGIE
ncbi:phosphoribosylformylglycinamidine cyclo-ligase [Desulfuribacillus alkaliarsenatis]|uniref:Phosphoribosylformylglycinamidine cyclo-ligase n=1 Tax=Desulfuribacillus alkaliarsenatis TaxID=766136 RepID=A0A1E5G246_9FIRM|nr:phosphoribosylformylglycinamidine cyclo-ligase [Desulfuribacillus alkaliarsenatis]OEF97014.1 phosphoribosylformylglycinamidine cyclo-ligase [Desulfuribacillus alkaliarsenatis]